MDKENKKKINSLFKQVVTMPTMDAFAFLNSTGEDPEIIENVVRLLSDSDTRTTFLNDNPEFDNILQPVTEERDLVGQSVGNIELLELLGKGGMGEVYLGQDKQLQRKVAVKTIRGVYRLNTQARDRFRREALILSKLNHNNICKIYNIIEIGDIDFLVLEFVDGKTMDQFPVDKFSYAEKLKLAKGLLAGLLAAHKEGIVHRDIKPDNIIISGPNSFKILDFGISASLKQPANNSADSASPGQKEQSENNLSVTKTNPGAIMGTLGYMSPEQAKGEEVATSSDIYSLGIIFQNLFSSQAAHPDISEQEILLSRARRGESNSVSGVPSDLTALINRMKSYKPASRPTALDAIHMLDRIIDKPKRRMKQIAVAALLILSVMAFSKYTYDLKQEKMQAETARIEAEKARDEAEQAKDESEQVTAFLENLFMVSDPYSKQGREITAEQILKDGAEKVNEELKDKPRILVRIKQVIGNVYTKRGEYNLARNQFEEALKLFENNKLEDARLQVETMGILAELEFYANDYNRMKDLLLQAIDLADKHSLRDMPDYLSLKFNLAAAYEELGQYQKAIDMFDELLNLYLQDEKKYRLELVTAYNYIGLMKADAGDDPGALIDLEKALRYVNEEKTTKDVEYKTVLLSNLATVYNGLQQYQKAVDAGIEIAGIRKRILGEKHPYLAITYDNISRSYRSMNDLEKAEQYNNMAVSIFESIDDFKNVDYATVLGNKAHIVAAAYKEYEHAETLYLQAIDMLQDVFETRESRFIADQLGSLAENSILQNKFDAALKQSSEAILIYDKLNRPMKKHAIDAWLYKAQSYAGLKQKDKELETYKAMLERLEKEPQKDEAVITEVRKKIRQLNQME